jgi:hypothetical protein
MFFSVISNRESALDEKAMRSVLFLGICKLFQARHFAQEQAKLRWMKHSG